MTQKNTPPKHLKFAVLSTDIVCFAIQAGQLVTLLGKVQLNPYYPNHWAAIGGLIKSSETAEQAVERLLKDKAGIDKVYKEQLYTFSAIDRDPRNRVVSVAYLGIVKDIDQQVWGQGTQTKWCPINDVPKLAYDHNDMFDLAIERLRSRMSYTNIARHFLPDEFTLSDLQKVYETVLFRTMDKRNFRKKILASKIIKDTKKTRKQGVMRPAALYTFTGSDTRVVELL